MSTRIRVSHVHTCCLPASIRNGRTAAMIETAMWHALNSSSWIHFLTYTHASICMFLKRLRVKRLASRRRIDISWEFRQSSRCSLNYWFCVLNPCFSIQDAGNSCARIRGASSTRARCPTAYYAHEVYVSYGRTCTDRESDANREDVMRILLILSHAVGPSISSAHRVRLNLCVASMVKLQNSVYDSVDTASRPMG